MSDRNRTTVRRALRGGLAVGVVAGVLLALAGAPPAGVVAAGIAAGAFVASTWLLLSVLLDVIAGAPPDRRRTLWTIGVTLVAMLGPFLLVGAFAQSGAT